MAIKLNQEKRELLIHISNFQKFLFLVIWAVFCFALGFSYGFSAATGIIFVFGLLFLAAYLILNKIKITQKKEGWSFNFPLKSFSKTQTELGSLKKINFRPVWDMFLFNRFVFEFEFEKDKIYYTSPTVQKSTLFTFGPPRILPYYPLAVFKEDAERIGKFFNVPIAFIK